MANQWRSESISHEESDLFVAIVTTLGGKQLIAQCTTLDFAKEIEDKHNRFDVEIGHLRFSLAGARDRAGAAEKRAAQFESTLEDVKGFLSGAVEYARAMQERAAQLEAERDELQGKLLTAIDVARDLQKAVYTRKGIAPLTHVEEYAILMLNRIEGTH